MRTFLVVGLVASTAIAATSASAGSSAAPFAAPSEVPAVSPEAQAAPPAAASPMDGWQYACDGTDEFLLAEVDEAFRTGIGFGETWDENVCDEGLLSVYANSAPARATTRWPAWRKPMVAPAPRAPMLSAEAALAKRMEDQFFALAMPVFGAVAFAFAAGIAALISVFLRLRKQIVVDVACPNPACKTALPFLVGDARNIFCPRCGGACRVDLHGSGKATTATAVPL